MDSSAMANRVILCSYYRSTAAYRVRIALAWKGIDYEYTSVRGLRQGDEAFTREYLKANPQGLVPFLVDGDVQIAQSLAIVEYLEETSPDPPLLPRDPAARAFVRSVAQYIASDIHPLNVMRVRKLLTKMGHGDDDKRAWYRHWLHIGFTALEGMLRNSPVRGKCCHRDEPTIADMCLVPQAYNATRFGFSLEAFPTVCAVRDHCETLPPFAKAHPDRQPDVSEYSPLDEY
jgi:maleylpyruvate isomerase